MMNDHNVYWILIDTCAAIITKNMIFMLEIEDTHPLHTDTAYALKHKKIITI